MPQFLVKVTDEHGWISPPFIAHTDTEEEAADAVRLVVGDHSKIEARGIRPDVMIAAFGEVAKGAVVCRPDWTWRGQGDWTPEPY